MIRFLSQDLIHHKNRTTEHEYENNVLVKPNNNKMKLYSIVLLGVASSLAPGLVTGRLHTNMQYATIKGTHNNDEDDVRRQLKGPKTATKTSTTPPQGTATSACEYDALILGLGWAGIAAMYELELFNNYTVVHGKAPIIYKGIEWADYYGGRIIAGELVSGADMNPIGELIHQLFSNNKNDPNYLLHSQQTWSDIFYYSLEDEGVMNAADISQARNSWNDAYECLQHEGNADRIQGSGPDGSPMRSMKDILAFPCSFNLTETNEDDPSYVTALEELLMWYELAWEFVADPEFATAAGNVPMYTYYLMQDKDWFVTSEQKLNDDGSIDVPGNLATVADKTVKTYILDYDSKAQLNTKVESINWTDANTCVNVGLNKTGSSGTITAVNASKVLTTFSVGALVDQAPSLFEPYDSSEIEEKIQALKDTFYIDSEPPYNNTIGLYKLLFVQLNSTIWESASVPNNEFIFTVPAEGGKEQIGKCTQWQSFDRFKWEFFDNSRSFACTLVSEGFKELAGNDGLLNDTMAQGLISNLFFALGLCSGNTCYPGCVRAPCDVHSSTCPNSTDPVCQRIDLFPSIDGEIDYPPWGDSSSCPPSPQCVYEIRDNINPKWKGSWSTFGNLKGGDNVGWNHTNYNKARAPIDSKLYFGGEALCPVWQGFQHGAWNSGREQAREMIYDLRGLNDTSDFTKDDWKTISDGYVTASFCEYPDGTPPIRKSKTVP